ncbi:hypothetical protein L1987_84777 [Smallanthus sonchifolius]|uniref:Uncharacterized protein n=1 Tax=Smallanthus sonchifolius TaxID=185202 RepID=A0ACB8XV89_9ASTR|nr:hypothetical protein L1987_84777 [Smallanthus sonchifolius]
MVDGWAGVAGEILKLKPLIFYHLKNFLLVKTEKDTEEAMDPGSLSFNTGEPQIQLYFLLGLVYAVVTPILLPLIVVFFGLAYVVYRLQIINVYNQQYESTGAFWPDVHGRIITALIVSQLLLMGLLSTKEAAQSTPLLIMLPVLTIWFHRFCKGRFEPLLLGSLYSQQIRSSQSNHNWHRPSPFHLDPFGLLPDRPICYDERHTRTRTGACLNVKDYLENAYKHPVFNENKWDVSDDGVSEDEWPKEPALVATKRSSRTNTPAQSQRSESTRTLLCVTDERSCPLDRL